MAALGRLLTEDLGHQWVAADLAVFEQQFGQGPVAQTLDGTPRPFDRCQRCAAASPDRGPAINAQHHLAYMALSASQGLLLLRPQGATALADDLYRDATMLAQARGQGAWRRQPLAQAGRNSLTPAQGCSGSDGVRVGFGIQAG